MKKYVTILLAFVLVLTGFTTNASAAAVKISKSKKTIYVGDTFKLKLKNVPKGAQITWKSSKDSIASVDDSGTVTGKKKGKATITAAYNDKSYKCKITVKKQAVSSGSSEFAGAKQGDVIKFGSYEQDNNPDNGNEPIEWIVLSKSDTELFVVSKYALDCKEYNDEYCEVTWETCTLRKWLNDEFFNSAFGKSEQSSILTTTLKNENNIKYTSINGGNDTKDKVFLLSLNDMINTDYGFSKDTDEFDICRRCAPTDYAIAQGVYASEDNFYNTADNDSPCNWQLRSPGISEKYAAYTGTSGSVVYGGSSVSYKKHGVRPAIKISLK